MEAPGRSVQGRAQVTSAGLFLQSGQNIANLALPTSQGEPVTCGAIHCFHYILTETLFREEQRSEAFQRKDESTARF